MLPFRDDPNVFVVFVLPTLVIGQDEWRSIIKPPLPAADSGTQGEARYHVHKNESSSAEQGLEKFRPHVLFEPGMKGPSSPD